MRLVWAHRLCLEFLPEKFYKDITDERGYCGNFKIGSRKDFSDCPSDASFLPDARALKFAHQEIRIEQEDDKTYLDHRSPGIFLQGNINSLVASIDQPRKAGIVT